MPVVSLLLPVTLLAEACAALAIAFSIALPGKRIWPPPRPLSWQSGAMWALFGVSAVGVVAVGVLDWGSWVLAPWIRWVVGGALWLTGTTLAMWGMATLGLVRTHGDKGTLARHGPYRFSRNPQYVGFIVSLIGWALVSASSLALPAALAGVVACALAPYAEEPWLRDAYGPAYDAFCRSVPRFLGLRARSSR